MLACVYAIIQCTHNAHNAILRASFYDKEARCVCLLYQFNTTSWHFQPRIPRRGSLHQMRACFAWCGAARDACVPKVETKPKPHAFSTVISSSRTRRLVVQQM